jgi:hypothetical protein
MERVRVLESYAERLSRDQELVASQNESSASRLVWFVAIAGYAFLNVPIYLRALSDESVSGGMLIIISAPWALTAVFGVITHWIQGELTSKDNQCYAKRIENLYALIMTEGDKISDQQVLDLLQEKNDDIQACRQSVKKLEPWVKWMSHLTFFSLCFSILWSVVFVLILLTP